MHDPELAMCAYAQLAVISHEKRQSPARDRFLLLTAVEACRAGWLDIANHCQQAILRTNPGHQLRNHISMADALRDPDFQRLAARWERYCPYEHAEHMLRQLGQSPAGDRPQLSRGEYVQTLLQSITQDLASDSGNPDRGESPAQDAF